MDSNDAKLVRMGAWSGVAFIVLFSIGWGVLGRNIPPYPGSISADELASIYRQNASTLKIGFALAAFSTTLQIPWIVGVFRVLLKMERGGQGLSYLWLIGGILTVTIIEIPCGIWLTAAFRPEQDPAIIQMLFDLGWLVLDIGFGFTVLQYVAFALIALRDPRVKPLFPTWFSWVAVWASLEFFVMLIMPFFREGAFSWAGSIGYWMTFFVPFGWMVLSFVFMTKASYRLEAEQKSETQMEVS